MQTAIFSLTAVTIAEATVLLGERLKVLRVVNNWLSARLGDSAFTGFVRRLLDATYQIGMTRTNRGKHHERVVYLLVRADALGGYLIGPRIRAAATTA